MTTMMNKGTLKRMFATLRFGPEPGCCDNRCSAKYSQKHESDQVAEEQDHARPDPTPWASSRYEGLAPGMGQ